MKAARFITKIVIFVFVFWLLAGCSIFKHSASWHVKKAKELDPSLFQTKTDTSKVAAGSFKLDADSLLQALNQAVIDEEEDGEVGVFVIYVDTPITDTDGNTREDSAKITITPIIKYRDRALTREDSLSIRNQTLTAEDSSRIFKHILNIEVDCPDCPQVTNTVIIKPTLWGKLEYLVYFLITTLIISGLYFGWLRRK